jgi:hypothetical protein
LKKMQRFALAAAGIGMLAATATAGPALAGSDPKPPSALRLPANVKAMDPAHAAKSAKSATAASATCSQLVSWVTPTGMVPWLDISPAKPPQPTEYEPYQFVGARAQSSSYLVYNASGTQLHMTGLFLQGRNLYRATSYIYDTSVKASAARIGSGWQNFTTIATSNYTVTSPHRSYLYGLNLDGTVYRYAASGTGFKALGKFAGFKSFKTLTVISETATYDTLLMTTKAGALYTIRIPVTATAKPVVKVIRTGGWQSFEHLEVVDCGTKGGALITAVDRDTKTAQLYAMSKANGKATLLTGYGRIPASDSFTGVFDGTADSTITGYYNQLVSE